MRDDDLTTPQLLDDEAQAQALLDMATTPEIDAALGAALKEQLCGYAYDGVPAELGELVLALEPLELWALFRWLLRSSLP